ncbi:class I SAM-dependent methyltransferase [Portibacter lacus]|uniref:Methyltransferase n=1 Tax=Portibacter lacus TaxID=1099794 RepID=A0AA37SLP4_9BACT|nr:class I SAM-dependent methyltransferase [Portibacter lacus]GLR15637.1 methyltransferase [Portibacter lacus]
MTEFWESSFKDKQAMWGLDPADSVFAVAEFFKKKELKEVLIPGYGYGRNAKVFSDLGLNVTGIEISETAIQLAKDHYGDQINVFHGSVSEMPFDDKKYDGIFCYALIHLLNEEERRQLIQDCYDQLAPEGYMVFTAISSSSPNYGQGEELSKDRFKTSHGVNLFFYDSETVQAAFLDYGLVDAEEVTEPGEIVEGKPYQVFWKIVCRKEEEIDGNR